MALANCPRCGSLFNKITRDICQNCYDEEEDLLRETQRYLRDNRSATVFEVMSELGVERWLLDKWNNEKRINILKEGEAPAKRQCMYCGREIQTGTICKTCQIKKLTDKKDRPAEPAASLDLEADKKKKEGMYFKRNK